MLPSHKLIGIKQVTDLAVIGSDFQPWYSDAMLEIVSVCNIEKWDVVDFTNKLSLLSPRVSVRRNVRAAYVYFGQGQQYVSGITWPIKKSIDNYNKTRQIKGKKTSCFAKALLGDSDSVTLDTWMEKALVRGDHGGAAWERKQTRVSATKLVSRVARRLRVSPRDCQAMIWAGTFRCAGSSPQRFPIMEEYDRWIAYDRNFPLSGDISLPEEPFSIQDILDESVSFEFGNQAF